MKTVFFCLLSLACFQLYGQEDSDVLDAFEDYTDLTREQVYLHLNKTVYIKGEMLGFNAYVFNGESKLLSGTTANLYCQVLDANDKVINEKLIMINQGISRGDFMIDSTYSSGEYTLKAYTNWLRNFNSEHTYYEEHFRVIDPETVKTDKPIAVSDDVDLQILPESGHLLSATDNVVGIIAKDSRGHGISNLNVEILDDADQSIAQVTLNQFGIGTFLMHPKPEKIYRAVFDYNEKPKEVLLPKADPRGIVLSIQPLKDHVAIKVKTNTATLPAAKQRNYKLYIHNGYELKDADLNFSNGQEIALKINSNDLFSGMNIFTLFDEDDRPIAERLYFNFNGIVQPQTGKAIVRQLKDSIEIKLPVKQVNQSLFQNLSVSVLPAGTKSYYHHENIISSLHLRPYLNSSIEQASYYFTDVTEKKQYELDQLLLTQGWSSYDWNTIFNAPPEYIHDFEVGIKYIINSNDAKSKELLIYPNINTSSELVSLKQGERLERIGLFPLDDEQLRIGEINRKGQLKASNVVLQFEPRMINGFETKHKPRSVFRADQSPNTEGVIFKFKDAEQLDEVKVTARKGYTRIEKLRNSTLGKITEFGDDERRLYRTFGQFISGRGFIVDEQPSVFTQTIIDGADTITTNQRTMFSIVSRNSASINATNVPTIFLDDVLLVDFDILNNFSMDWVDYVEVNKGGVGGGIRGGAGVIKIYTDPSKRYNINRPKESFKSYDIPLTYVTPKKFYVPKYNSFESPFFKAYGVIDWFPNLSVGNDEYLTLKVLDTDQPIKLFIEGLVNNESLLSQVINIDN